MAERKPTTQDNYNSLISEIKSGSVAPVYLLQGTESYYIDKVCDFISNNLLTEEEKDFNFTMLYGSETTAQQIVDQARRFPMMAARQVVIVREAQALKKWEALEKYMEKPVPTTVLVFCHKGGSIDGRKSIGAKISRVGKVFTSDALRYDSQIVAFIMDYVKSPEYGASIDSRVAQVVAAHIGGDLKRLTSELDKINMNFSPGAPRVITSEIVEKCIGISKNYNVFELRDALISRDALKAQRILKYFVDNPKDGLFNVVPSLFNFFQNLMLCYYAPRPITEAAIMSQLGLKAPWQVRDYMAAMRTINGRKCLDIITKLREVDARIKGLDNVSTPPGDLMQELVTFILH